MIDQGWERVKEPACRNLRRQLAIESAALIYPEYRNVGCPGIICHLFKEYAEIKPGHPPNSMGGPCLNGRLTAIPKCQVSAAVRSLLPCIPHEGCEHGCLIVHGRFDFR